ncbi:Na+/H+ antiporter NhaA [Nocardioides astragali]|uniref:Na(+)/H(+) antiporter NhaA n=1 Tax=Nocardioides astragali TaxID=1776736 RepID=A0ABW2N4L3_9ACTN|nr:Na+/H+ antiporter NhaA [Nocardioides astragali]
MPPERGSPDAGARIPGDWTRQSRARAKDMMNQVSAPARAYVRTESASSLLLLISAVAALLIANSSWSAAYEQWWHTDLAVAVGDATLSMDLRHWVNDGLMVLFFFSIGLEVRREASVGELRRPGHAGLPLLAGIGGVVVPVLIYLIVNPSGDAARGWGVVVGTDTAFMLGALAIVGPTWATQLRLFLLALTVVDDLVAVAVIAIVYSHDIDPAMLSVAAIALAMMALLAYHGTWRAGPYVGLLLVAWVATVLGGVHASLTGMVAGLLIAARAPDPRLVEDALERYRSFRQSPLPRAGRRAQLGVRRAVSTNERLQTALHPWTSFVIVPIFAFANAGVDLRDGVLTAALTSPLTWGVIAGLVIGKLVGIGGAVALGLRLRLGVLPQGVRVDHILGGAALSGIGFTVSLLIVGLAFDDAGSRADATVGVLIAAVLSTALGRCVFAATRRRRGIDSADLPRHLDEPVDPSVDHIRGNIDAPLTLVEYGDFECPFCARATGVTRELLTRFGDDLRYVFRHLPLTEIHSHAALAARAAEAASRQDAFWSMHDLLFAHHDDLTLEVVASLAADLDLDVTAFLDDLDSPDVEERVARDIASAEASGARGTPTFFVNGQRVIGAHDTQTLTALLTSHQSVG